LQSVLPRAVLNRRDKAEFSSLFRMHMDGVADTLVDAIPLKRPGLVDRDGVARLVGSYRQVPQLGWPMWALWGIYGCDKFLDGCVGRIPSDQAQHQ